MTEFVIHLGPHKTGSTHIQLGLDRASPLLLQHGIVVPSDWRDSPGNPSHTGFVRRLNRDGLPALERAFAGWVSDGYKKVVISCEGLMTVPPESLAMVRKLVSGNPLTVVFYVRRWSEVISSSWNETIVHGYTEAFPEFLLGALRDPYGSSAINIAHCLEPLVEVFGQDAIRIVSYNEVIDTERDLFAHFARQFLGVSDIGPQTAVRANSSFDRTAAEILRMLNILDRSEGVPQDARNAIAWRDKIARLDVAPLKDAVGKFLRTVDLDDKLQPFASILAANYRQYASQLVSPYG